MSDASSIGQILQRGIQTGSRDDLSQAKVISLPEKLERADKAIKIRGEVTSAQKDGTIKILTDQGEVVIKANNANVVKEGKTVEITIPNEAEELTAYLRSIPNKLAPGPNQPPKQDPKIDTPYINTPRQPALTPQSLVQSTTPIPVEYVIAPALTDVIYTPPSTQAVPTQDAFVTGDLLNLYGDYTSPVQSPISISVTNDADNFSVPMQTFSPLPLIDDADVWSSHTLNKIIDHIPLPHIAAKLISAPLQAPIDAESIDTFAPFQSVEVKSVSLSDIRLINIDGDEKTVEPNAPTRDIIQHHDLRAGDTKAIVDGFTKEQHFPVLRLLNIPSSDQTRYVLKTPVQDMPSGMVLDLDNIQMGVKPQSQNMQATPLNSAAPIPIPSSFFLTPEIWGSMQDIQTTLSQHAPQIAQAFGNVIPSPAAPNQMGAAALFFLAAMRSGDIQSWLGEKAVDALKRAGKGDLISKLGGELGSLARLNRESASAEWRMLSLPMAWQNEIHKVVVQYRKENNEQQNKEKKSGGTTRFVMDLNLSNMGKVQVDGLFKSKDKRLDAVLRTEQSFSGHMKAEMRSIYKDALDETEITGELSFQEAYEHWVNINAGENVDFSKDV